MKRLWRLPAMILTGILAVATCALPQGTISARPGVVNYIEGHAFVDGKELSASKLKGVTLYANQTLSTDIGKAEVLLTPGVFLRIGDNSAVRMISPSLTDTQFEVLRGEAMIEAAQIVKDSTIQAIAQGSTITIQKAGLYRISAGTPPVVSVFDGKALVLTGEQKNEVKKGRELVLAANAKPEKFDRKKEDDLYAWSNVRSEYEAGASYASARTAALAGSTGSGFGYSYAGGVSPGWYYNGLWNSWAWLPGAGYAFSPFGYGFFSPGYVGYAPVIVGGGVYPGVYGRHHGQWANNGTNQGGHDANGHQGAYWHGHNGALVPVDPNHPPAQGMAFRSPAALAAARSAAMHNGVGARAMMAAPQAGGGASMPAMNGAAMHGPGSHAGAMSGGGGHFGGGHPGGAPMGGHMGGAPGGGGHMGGAAAGAGHGGGGASRGR